MPLDLHLASISVSYNFDLAGGTRRELEGLRAEVNHQAVGARSGTRLIPAGIAATTAIREGLRCASRSRTTRKIVSLQARQLAIAERMEALGGVARADVITQQRELAQARATLPDLRRDLERMRHRLALYIGLAPSASGLPEFRMAELQLPAELPLSLPSQLARQRPRRLGRPRRCWLEPAPKSASPPRTSTRSSRCRLSWARSAPGPATCSRAATASI